MTACSSPTPAPIVSRTLPAGRPSTPAPAPAPVPVPVPVPVPAVAPAPAVAAAVAPAPAPDPTVQTAPVRSGAIESRGIESRGLDARAPGVAPAAVPLPPPAFASPGPTLPPNTRTAPRGNKVPYSETALAELRAADPASAPGAGPAVSGLPAVTAAAAPPASGGSALGPSAPTAAPEPRATDGEGEADWSWPAAGRAVQSFTESGNKGVVIGGKIGDPVVAAADGRVIFSGVGPRGYGNLVIVKHAKELLSVYAHNRSLAVREGQAVKRGQKIAELGDSGTTSPRLHFEIRQQGKPVDPARYLPKR